MNADDDFILDSSRSWCFCTAGQPDHDFIAAVALDADGSEHLVLAERASMGDDAGRYDVRCADAEHEQLGPLPIEFVRRLAISQRTRRHNPEGTTP